MERVRVYDCNWNLEREEICERMWFHSKGMMYWSNGSAVSDLSHVVSVFFINLISLNIEIAAV